MINIDREGSSENEKHNQGEVLPAICHINIEGGPLKNEHHQLG